LKKLVLATFLLAFLALGNIVPPGGSIQPRDGPTDDEKTFPITIDFECPRNFGFHIGDEIPVIITLEAREGTVLDLVNLPQEKETHGSFEIRDLKVRKRRKRGRTFYEVLYRLQSFQPAIAVDRLNFPPLRISYATKDNWNRKESKYQYQSLFAQIFEIFVSRTATYFGPMKDIKGPVKDNKFALMWKATIGVGGLLVILGLFTWPWELIRNRQRIILARPVETPSDRALKALQQARDNCFNYDDHRKRLFFEMNRILRDFLGEVCGLKPANRPSMEVVKQLKDCPFYEELRDLVVRINQVIYEGDAPVDVESIVRQFSGLLEKADTATPSRVSDDKAG
jgi:hypothetical protein